MQVIELLLYFSLIYIILEFILNLVGLYVFKKYYPTIKRKLSKPIVCPKITILVALLHEKKSFPHLIKSLKRLNYDKNKVNFVFITTEKERLFDKSNNTTIELVKNFCKKESRFIHINYPKKEGRKAEQLNYSLNILQKQSIIDSDTFIGLFDAESKIDEFVLKEVALNYREKGALVQQGFGDYFANFKEQSIFVKYFSIYQTFYTYTYEFFMNYLKRKYKTQIYMYSIGHNFFIQYGLLKKIGLFPVPIEDVPLGYLLSKNNISVSPLISADTGGLAKNLFGLIKQQSVWYYGELSLWKYVELKTNVLIRAFLRIIGVIEWLTSTLWGILIIVSIFIRPKLFLLWVIVWYSIVILRILFVKTTLSTIFKSWNKNLSESNFLLLLFCAPFVHISRGLGPMFTVVRNVLEHFNKKQFNFYKTER